MEPDVPPDSPQRTFEKKGLPKEFNSTYPFGLISGHQRSPAAQKAFEARKATILRTMNKEQMENAYEETVNKILAQVEDDKKKNDEILRELHLLEEQRKLERKLYNTMKEAKKGKLKRDSEGEVKAEEDG